MVSRADLHLSIDPRAIVPRSREVGYRIETSAQTARAPQVQREMDGFDGSVSRTIFAFLSVPAIAGKASAFPELAMYSWCQSLSCTS
jgi:hypothetical protein